MLLLELVLELLEALQSLVHIHVLSCSISSNTILGLVAAEILLRITEMLQMSLLLSKLLLGQVIVGSLVLAASQITTVLPL